MKYTVVMKKTALNQLTSIWNGTTDQQAVADASNRIERELANDSHAKGNGLGVLRTYRDDPLEYLFQVDPGDCMVRIFRVRRTT